MAEDSLSGLDQAAGSTNYVNAKVIGEIGAHTLGLAMQNAVAHQNRMNILAESFVAAAVKVIHEVDPIESVSVLKTLSGNDLAQQLAQLLSALAMNQQGAKVAQTTPPETGK